MQTRHIRLLLLLLQTCFFGGTRGVEQHHQEPLKVIFAGFGRFGSHSLAAALNRIGFNSVHGENIIQNLHDSHRVLGRALMEGDVEQILDETSLLGYNATMECHAVYWREIMEKRPDVKVIFLMREFDSWFSSMVDMRKTSKALSRYPMKLLLPGDISEFSMRLAEQTFLRHMDLSEEEKTSLGYQLAFDVENKMSKELHREAHAKFVQDARDTLEKYPNNSILFRFGSDGYQELCDFLEIPTSNCPIEESFPHLSSSSDLQKLRIIFLVMDVLGFGLPLLIILILIWISKKQLAKHQDRLADKKIKKI